MAEKWKGVPYKIPEDPAPTQAEIEALLDTNIEDRLSERDLKLLMAQIAHDSMSEEENVAEIERENREIAEQKEMKELKRSLMETARASVGALGGWGADLLLPNDPRMAVHKRRYFREMVPAGYLSNREQYYWDTKATDYALDATKRELDAVGGIPEDLTPNQPRVRQFIDDLRYGRGE